MNFEENEDYQNWSINDLIEYIKRLKQKRELTYEERMKLIILDKSPFTIWASDRNCTIKLWEGKCESMYGYSKLEVLGKDYVDLFVATDEKNAARKDQLSIIDNGEVFHNIANDKGRNGNNLKLITYCSRIQDPQSGEFWNAEIGIPIDYYEEEKKLLNQRITESRMISACIKQFTDSQKQYLQQFNERKKALLTAMRECEIKAIKLRKRIEYKKRSNPIDNSILAIENDLDSMSNDYLSRIKNSSTYNECEKIRYNFTKKYDEKLLEFYNLVIDFEEINTELCIEEGEEVFVTLNDTIMKDTSSKNNQLTNEVYGLLMKIEGKIEEYNSLGNVNPMSNRLKRLESLRNNSFQINKDIAQISSEIYSRIISSKSKEETLRIQEEMEERFDEVDKKIKKLRKDINNE